MPRIDDYIKAVEIGKMAIKGKNPRQIAEKRGVLCNQNSDGKVELTFDFLNRKIAVTWPELDFSIKETGDKIPVQQQNLLLHYLIESDTSHVENKWIAYQEVPDGKFYLDAFNKRAKIPMLQAFGSRPELLVELATSVYGARPLDHGDFSVVLNALPLVPVALILWEGDDEFPPEGTLLFDRSISGMLSAEDIAWLAGMIIYPLIGMARNK